MPAAGDEGYEVFVICPYDRAHEIRKGRMQFHIEKCRRNFPGSDLVECPYNKIHMIPEPELNYHIEEECSDRRNWERYTHDDEVAVCPVKDLVPVNAATLPDGDENWDNFEAQGSVLNNIKSEAQEKPILRMLQVASKASRKKFRMEERKRHGDLADLAKSSADSMSDTASVISNSRDPLSRPKLQPAVSRHKANPNEATAIISKMNTIDINAKPPAADVAPSESSSSVDRPPSVVEAASSSRRTSTLMNSAPYEEEKTTTPQMAFSYAAVSKAPAGRGRGASGPWVPSRPGSAMSNVSSGTYGTAMSSTPSTAHRQSGVASRLGNMAPPSNVSNNSRPSSVMSNSSYSSAVFLSNPNEDGFCQVPIPGLGRGRKNAS
ncbi:uncharacterized protein LOC129002187 [Macrosteles quadrilineatus]|uniref:uncharacterized protein LOC129002187 n=1 Tax=Macrosteles quadrilineatus TaxID=74068 RepID=UPI0023E11ECA|nr:uncharacterized protein LOC129002187 [Macrosteles quadrilineatus]